MCSVCGCGPDGVHFDVHGGQKPGAHDHAQPPGLGHHHHGHHHHHDDHHHEHHGGHDHDHGGEGLFRAAAGSTSQTRLIQIEQDILAKNNKFAAGNRSHFKAHGILTLNLLSSPGSGKTSLLVRTIELMKAKYSIQVIEGDQQTSADAERIRATGVPALQINTGKGCHLDGHMVGHAIETLRPADDSILFIENVGNLVCPASFDLGEAHKVVILSVTEGEDKPLKYPDMFAAADLVIFSKIDLVPHLDIDLGAMEANALKVNPKVKTLHVSSRTGEGLAAWISWIEAARAMTFAGRVAASAAL